MSHFRRSTTILVPGCASKSHKPATVRDVVTVTAARPRYPEHDPDLKRQRADLIDIFKKMETQTEEEQVA